MEKLPRLVWLVGASSGIGKALAMQMANAGWQVAISARRLAPLQAMQAQFPALYPYTLDVTDAGAVQQVFATICSQHGVPDICLFNAGDYEPMPVEAFDLELFRKLTAVNYLGMVNGLNAVLPLMLERGRGQILLTASLSAYRGLPRAAPYSASKAAVLNLAEALHPELKIKGILLRVINPGFVRSALTDKNPFAMPFLMDAEEAAAVIMRELDGSHFEITFPKRFALLMKLLRLLPYRWYFWITRRMVT